MMATVTTELLKKSFEHPDEVRELPKARVEVIKLGGYSAMRVRFEPGWRWSEHMKPAVGTESCEVRHVVYVISGQLATRMNDGSETIFHAGDFAVIPPGHDGWVVGGQPAEIIDFEGGERYGIH
jgi:quercetin dioxygenase-like cupin family protein